QDHAGRAFGTGQGRRQVPVVFRQQVFQRVSGDLSTETPKIGTQYRDIVHHKCFQTADAGERIGASANVEHVTGTGQPAHGHHIVCGPTVGQPVWATSVIADHAADGCTVGRGRIRPKP